MAYFKQDLLFIVYSFVIQIIMRFKIFFQIFLLLNFLLIGLSSCGIYRKTDARDIPTSGVDRARKNVTEGRGISLKNFGKGSTNYEFASSNPLWRATLTTIDFLPLTTVDYSGGIIITDWYTDDLQSNNYIKITVNFLSNEIRSDSLKIIVHQKKCDKNNNCKIFSINSKIATELQVSILKQAAILSKTK